MSSKAGDDGAGIPLQELSVGEKIPRTHCRVSSLDTEVRNGSAGTHSESQDSLVRTSSQVE